jgi:hypothetical protein
MAVKGNGFAPRVSRWKVTLTNAKEHEDEVPHIKEDVTRLEGLSEEADLLLSRGEDLRSQARENTNRLREVVKEGDALRRRMGATLQGKYGFTSEKLIKFGFKPRVVNRRRKVEKPTIEGGEGAQAGGKK